ncbi:MAG: M48 family metallopeptidase [Deltaproteobacteria bacterium]|nr:M48 family metallopeptidase [Deltaproteobacteria bacterium]
MWEQIRANQRRSFFLIAGMSILLVGCGFTFAEVFAPGAGPIGLLIAAGLLAIQLLIYAAAGQSVLLQGLGARELPREECPRLFNIVEEMQLASGLPVAPKVYLIDDPAPNAFAFGRKPEQSGVAVTSGLLSRLNRDQLQGVIAHELGHIKNRDTRFLMLAAVLLASVALLSEIFWRMLRSGGRAGRRSSARGGGQAMLIILAIAILLAIFGPIGARLLYFACSRKREYLADAASAQFTRYPEGLAGALETIATTNQPMARVNKTALPMFIVHPLRPLRGGHSIFATHPPIDERIGILRAMGNASFHAYDTAMRQLRGRSAIGAHTLGAEQTQPEIRSAAAEGPVMTAHDAALGTYATAGYRAITCGCGIAMKIPPTYPKPTIRCMRCGTAHSVGRRPRTIS